MASPGAGRKLEPRDQRRRNPVSTILIGVDESTRSQDAVAFGR
jgi:hypothetical protein